ncbi:hypothetical protein V2P56_02520 [Mycoplasma capricolum subsp. capricolum]|uniref:hypothetical protein n=1 Tax=Mycoplasma capricolum TaxID=2095 RepID=UPI003DA69637
MLLSILIVFSLKIIFNFYNLNLISNVSNVNDIGILTLISSFIIGISIIITSNCVLRILVDLSKVKLKI